MPSKSPHAAAFENVVKEYRTGWLRRQSLRALDGVTLHIKRGEVFGLVGPNRAGKTTLVKLLLALGRPTSGTVERLGSPADDRATLARVGYVHEHPAFPRYLTATQVMEYYGALSLLTEPVVKQRVPQLLEQAGLADRAHEPIGRFSKGMAQRLAMAQALVNDPELLILDEPSEGLDLPGRKLVRNLVTEQRGRGHTVILVSHLLTEVEHLCDRVGVLVGGRLVHVGTVTKLLDNAPSLEAALERLYGMAPSDSSPEPAPQESLAVV